MTEYVEVDRETFFDTIDAITYRNQDIAEALEFGCNSILNCYQKARHRFAKYFVVYEDSRPIVTVMLQRDGQIIFFISDTVNNSLALVRELRNLCSTTVAGAGAIMTKTASWYTEAKRLNELTGFRVYAVVDYYEYWVAQ